MTKLHRCFGLVLLAVLSFGLTGCQLYFGEDDEDDWGYCAPDGYYRNGERVSATCPDPAEPGMECEGNSQCAAGCYCGPNGKCEEAGFCSKDSDCPKGYKCDERSSCVPNDNPSCSNDGDCLAGSVCTDNKCETTCVCESDADAQAQGYGFCDEIRATCKHKGPASCGGVITCTNPEPVCPQGSVPMTNAGCWADADANGQPDCGAIASCDVTPACAAFQHEPDCAAGAGCTIVYKGIGCTKPGGGTCLPNEPGCVCTSYAFDECR